ncbi:hypothetical protein H9651_06650 [Microbacterium sp. Sa4CUA7]|uniref:Phage holin family protein n=1 Tax=Microbacterium pullorum TaxID=2762236 RepID=A0ABR8S1F7_9MICO|nr:hypothetical protein [Microbacterium pullorum]MBD7957312.1 hypothetical protein [Microbacterium pullorum]
MKTWVVRFASLYVFNVVVLVALGALLPRVSVGWAALWAGVVLTAATIWLKPVIAKAFRGMAAKSADQRTRVGEKLVQAGLVFVVELIVWVLVVLLSSVHVSGLFWGWVVPPPALLVAWLIYDAVDDRIEARAGRLYDRARGGRRTAAASDAPAPPFGPASTATAGRPDATRPATPDDGLTDEQRRLFDDLGKG